MTMVRASRRLGRMRHGRHAASSIRLAKNSRKAVAPDAPTAGNSCFATTAPIWKLNMATISTATGNATELGLNGEGSVTIIHGPSNFAD
jgi:hypothetical protein